VRMYPRVLRDNVVALLKRGKMERTKYYDNIRGGRTVTSSQQTELVRENWRKVAEKFGELESATIRDLHARHLQTNWVATRIKPTDRIIDVGCGNGYATAAYAKVAAFAIGVDYQQGFIDVANHKFGSPNLQFMVGDICELSEIYDLYGEFDKVICERTLINLPSWEEQVLAIGQLMCLLRSGGELLLLEVTTQGHEYVDAERELHGLDPLEKHWNNVYIDEGKLFSYMREHKHLLAEREDYGLYMLLSRVLHAALVSPDAPKFDAKINAIAAELNARFELRQSFGHMVSFRFIKDGDW